MTLCHRAPWAGLLCVLLAGCGLQVASPDLFVLTRTGEGRTFTALVNDAGTIRCDGGSARTLPDPLLLAARDLATSLDTDAKRGMTIRPRTGSIYTYRFKLQDGTVSFADTAVTKHVELGRAALLATQLVDGPCSGR